MTLLEAIMMGLIQGLTEFLPVSSSGHLNFMKQILNVNTDTGLLFDVLLHLGTLIAIFLAFWDEIKQLFIEGCSILYDVGKNGALWISHFGKKSAYHTVPVITTPYRRFVISIIISTIPTGIIGFLMKDLIESTITSALIPGLCLVLTAVLLIMADRYPSGDKSEGTTTWKDAIFLGISQGVATVPGLSRSGTTITAGLSRGFERSYAVRYSFIMSIPAVLGAVVLELKDITNETVTKLNISNYLVGMSIAAVVGFICIKTMLVMVRGKKFTYFAVYCFLIGTIAVISSFLR